MATADIMMTGAGGDDMEIDDNDDNVVEDAEENAESPSLCIPITSSLQSSDLFIEIFPEEISETPVSSILQVLKDEDASLAVWADAALLYIQQKQHSRDSSTLLQSACDRPGGNREERVRILASAGIAHLTQAQQSHAGASGGVKRPGNDQEDLRSMADNRFTHASKVDTLFPMTWMGRGMLNLSVGRLDQARFFFDTTLNECGQVLPALLGMAAVLYGENEYKGAQEMYAKAMKLYPTKSGAASRVGFGLACYRLGQVRTRA
jgi:tetratricopeptide (TPR) repeat protein